MQNKNVAQGGDLTFASNAMVPNKLEIPGVVYKLMLPLPHLPAWEAHD